MPKNKVVINGVTQIDLSPTTALATDVASGKYFFTADGTLTLGTGSGGGGSYVRTVIVPQQTVTMTTISSHTAAYLSTASNVLETDADYIITFNGVEYWYTCQSAWFGKILGESGYLWGTDTEQIYPFLIQDDSAETYLVLFTYDGYVNTNVSIKVEKVELLSGGTTLTTKNITQNGTYSASSDSADGYSEVTVNVSGGSVNIGTVTTTNSSNQNTSIDFTLPSGRTPKAFFCRLTSQIARNSSSRYYYVYDMRWDGSSTGGVEGNTFYMYSGTLTNVTSGYSKSQSNTTFTLSSTGSRSASPGSFYNGTYELVYVY